ncbi:MAG: hypothetical protein M1826_006926 [Phylliscum demangeonii]|nr:MAG: hypothetical protein M1826_006926 [Phylliscum demangeonii]
MRPTSMSHLEGQRPRREPSTPWKHAPGGIRDHAAPVAQVPEPTSLTELAHLLRLQRHLVQKCRRLRSRRHHQDIAASLSARLVRCGDMVQTALVDHLRLGDVKRFAALHHAFHDLRVSCEASRRYAFVEPDLDIQGLDSVAVDPTRPRPSFFHQMPRTMSADFLLFLSEIRNNPDFLAARVASLSLSELSAFSTSDPVLDPVDSMSSASGRAKAPGVGFRRQALHSPSPVERLLSFQRHDPLAGLMHTIFSASGGPNAAEDRKRTAAWSATCARLITEATPGGEHFMCLVLNAWAGMRAWPIRRHLELLLTSLLQEGAFVLDHVDYPAAGPRTPGAPRAGRESRPVDEFFDNALGQLLDMIDDGAALGGLPEGAVELGVAILRRLENPHKKRAACTFIISKWFFSGFLLNALTYPETHGMLANYHVSLRARKKILRELAARAQRLVWEVAFDWEPVNPMRPDIRCHIENILASLPSRSSLPATSLMTQAQLMTSPVDASAMPPCLVLCPLDLATLVNALFPERRPLSSFSDADWRRGGSRPTAASLFGITMPSQPRPPSYSGTEPGSVLSTSGSSITSDTLSREPASDGLGRHDDGRSSYTSLDSRETLMDLQRPNTAELSGQLLRAHVARLAAHLGAQVASGALHPCAEQWAVLFISDRDGSLMTAVPHSMDDADDPADHERREHAWNSSRDGQDAAGGAGAELDFDKFAAAVTQLLQEYDPPRSLGSESDRLPVLPPDRNTPTIHHIRDSSGMGHERHGIEDLGNRTEGGPSPLQAMFERAIRDCQGQMDLVKAHLYWECLQTLRALSSSSLAQDGHATLVSLLARGRRGSVEKLAGWIEEDEARLFWSQQGQGRLDDHIGRLAHRLDRLRDKMWYATHVQHSAVYEEAKNIAVALRAMGQLPKTSKTKTPFSFHPRNLTRATAGSLSLLQKAEIQVVDLLAARPEQGGLNKLSDEQSDMTDKWLKQQGIARICQGEERIHRFCLEIHRCVGRLTGHDINAAPVLWSSDLYHRDRVVVSGGYQKGDLYLTDWGTLRPVGEDTAGMDAWSRTRTEDTTVGSAFGREARSGASPAHDAAAAKGRPAPIHPMRSATLPSRPTPSRPSTVSEPFWSPFHTPAPSPAEPGGLAGPRHAYHRENSVPRTAERSAPFRDKFLRGLRQTLTELLLADLGAIALNGGSETDAWFSGELGEWCLGQSVAKAVRHDGDTVHGRPNGPPPAVASPRGPSQPSDISFPTRLQAPGDLPPTSPLHESRPGGRSVSSSAGLDLLTSPGSAFPYASSFEALVRLFSAQASPFAKLDTLHQLEVMILTSLTVGRPTPARPERQRSEASGSVATTAALSPPGSSQTTTTTTPTPTPVPGPDPRRTASGSLADGGREAEAEAEAEAVVRTLATLFRDRGLRPKTLFRDLQLIAAMVPRAELASTAARGRAFQHASLAAIALKEAVCRMMIETADAIVAYQTTTRSLSPARRHPPVVVTAAAAATDLPSTSASASASAPAPAPPRSARDQMGDAAHMLSIAAKEGFAAAQRELAIFYLTHPDLVARSLLPFSRPRDVFKAQMMSMHDGDPARSDPATLCVAYHWLELSSLGGDEVARQNLRAREELNALP